MPPRPILYLAGRSFFPGHDGQARRLQLLTRALGDIYRGHPRYILAPSRPAPAEYLAKEGWQWLPIDQARGGTLISRLATWWRFLWWRWLAVGGEDILAWFGGSRVWAGPATRAALTHPNAIVIVGRCEFAGLVRLRQPGQTWILDSNDSVWNLVSVYGQANRYRWLTASSHRGWLARLKEDELACATKFDRIICIAKEDVSYYGEAKPHACVLEDTDILVPDDYARLPVEFDVGFIGGSHLGSRISARTLLSIACRPGLEHVRFAVAGGVCNDLTRQELPANVSMLGRVENSLEFLSRCQCSVIVSGRETGASVKFQEALAAECVVIANRLAARHSLATPGVNYIEVETVAEVEGLLREGRHRTFRAPSLRDHFRYETFRDRLATALMP